MKKALSFLVIASMLLSACQDEGGEGTASDTAKQAETEKVSAASNGMTVLELKKKYGSAEDKAIMPMYNVPQDKVFDFTFNADLGDGLGDYITVHTDIKALPESKVLAFKEVQRIDGKTVISIKPVGSGPLASESMKSQSGSSWGNAPIYYIRINYDLDAATPTKLDQPIIIPFTVKSELPVPNLKADVSSDGRLKLVWDQVEGAEKYRIYNARTIELLKNTNKPVTGAEKAYAGVYPLVEAEVTATEFDDFMKDGKHGLLSVDEELVSQQNFGVGGEYYVTAVKGDVESRFSAAVNTTTMSDLPEKDTNQLSLSLFKSVKDLPQSVSVTTVGDAVIQRDVVYATTGVNASEYGQTKIPYTIKGTALKGIIFVEQTTQAELEALSQGAGKEDNTGYIPPQNNTDFVPKPDVPTIIQTGDEAPAKDDVVSAQKNNTEKQVDEGNQQAVAIPSVKEMKVHADSALEEYLALAMIDGQDKISLKAFPEAQNFEVLADTMQKVLYQNPLILGARQYAYDYKSLALLVKYDFSRDEILRKQQEIVAEAAKITASLIKTDMTPEQKVKAIYDYLNDNTKYDDEALKNAEENNFKGVDHKFDDSFNTYGIMVKKIGVCASYASTFKMLSDLAGAESIVVTGDMQGVPHAWNKVKLDNEWFDVDSTNNATNSGVPYLLYESSDATAKSLGFTPGKEYWLDNELDAFEAKNSTKDYYVVHGLEVKEAAAFGSKVAEKLKAGDKVIVLRMGAKIPDEEWQEATVQAFNDVAKEKLATAKFGGLGTYIIIEP